MVFFLYDFRASIQSSSAFFTQYHLILFLGRTNPLRVLAQPTGVKVQPSASEYSASDWVNQDFLRFSNVFAPAAR